MIFGEVPDTLYQSDGSYNLTTIWPLEYTYSGDGVVHNGTTWEIDVPQLNTGPHTITFKGKSPYQGKTYDYPITYTYTIDGPAHPDMTDLTGAPKWKGGVANCGEVFMDSIAGKFNNYQAAYIVDLALNGVTVPNITVNADGSFLLKNIQNIYIPYQSSQKTIAVKAVYTDTKGNKSRSDGTIAVPTPPLGIGNRWLSGAEATATAYPNPATSILYLDGDRQTAVSIQIANPMGQVMQLFNSTFPMATDIQQLPAGMYWVKIAYATGGCQVIKIIKK